MEALRRRGWRKAPDLAAPGRARAAPRGGRRRRPSGEPPPLPRQLGTSGWLFLSMGVAVAFLWASAFTTQPFSDAVTRIDEAVLRTAEDLRAEPLTTVMRDLHALGSQWAIRPLRWGTVIALLALRRFRHLSVFVGATLVVQWLTTSLANAIARPRPFVEVIGDWDGFSHPSRPVAALALSLVGILYTLVPRGTLRNRGKLVAGALVTGLAIARCYLGVDHPSDVIVAVVIGMAVPVVAFRLITPNDAFPVDYRRRRMAHLDLDGRRREAIRQALEDQLGLEVVTVEPFALAASAGSTPLRLELAASPGEPVTHLFGKLYATSHLRSDRWYKLGRTIRYGRLEDEHPFQSVRALVEYEDYLLRLMRDAGLPTAEPFGLVEITPEREYLIVTSFFEDATEITEAEVDDTVIDHGLAAVRCMWDAGLAHRDIKPANLLVADGRVLLIDVAFGTVRPSPWRQAVDLANMMLVLALRTEPERVYDRTIRVFDPEEIAEAFAATHGITVPAQLRALLKEDGRDLVGTFRSLAPSWEPISIQRWSLRRIALTTAVAAAALVTLNLLLLNLSTVGL